MRALLTAAVLGGLGGLGGCDPHADEAADLVVVERSGATLGLTPVLVRLASGYAAELDVGTLTDAQLRTLAVDLAQQRLELLLAFTACEGTIESDGERTVHAVFSQCPLYGWSLSGDVTGTVEVTTPPCDEPGAPTCPARTATWRLDIARYSIDRLLLEDIEVRGAIEVSRELVDGGAVRWAIEDLVVDGVAGRTIGLDSEATLGLDPDDDECVTLDASARLQVDPEDDLDLDVGDIVLSARGVHVCRGRCPREGHVDISFGAGRLLRWDYEDRAEITVTGPRGRSLGASLQCTRE